MTLPLDSEFSDTPTGMQSAIDAFEKAVQPGHQTAEQAANPLDRDLYPPDYTLDPLAYARWKRTNRDRLKGTGGIPGVG